MFFFSSGPPSGADAHFCLTAGGRPLSLPLAFSAPMRLRIKDIPDQGIDLEEPLARPFLSEALDGIDADLEHCQALAKLHVSLAGDSVLARGQLTGTLTLPCARCLEPATAPLDVPVRMLFAPDGEMGEENDRVEDDLEIGSHDRHTVVFDQLVREVLILAVPLTPLCRPDCRGLCPICGEDRNAHDCGCEKPADPRLEAIRAMKV
jgi:uncharacterized protein